MPKTSLLSLIAAALLCFALPAWGQELPEGKGKDLVAAHCNSCHPFYARLGAGYTPKGWRTVMRMMANHGVTLPADQAAVITEYLTKNFPEKDKPVGVVIPGPTKVSIKEWQVPTPGSRPHDPLAARDGSLWNQGQMTTCSAGSIRRLAASRNIPSRRRTPGRMAWSRTRTATSGTPATPGPWSASLTRRRVRSPNTRCRT